MESGIRLIVFVNMHKTNENQIIFDISYGFIDVECLAIPLQDSILDVLVQDRTELSPIKQMLLLCGGLVFLFTHIYKYIHIYIAICVRSWRVTKLYLFIN